MSVLGFNGMRGLAMSAAPVLVSILAGCLDPPPNPPVDDDMSALELIREGTTLTPTGKIPAKYYWVWDPKERVWDYAIYVFSPVTLRDDGLASGARGAATSTSGGAPNAQSIRLPNAALFAGGIGRAPEFTHASPQAYFYDFTANTWTGLEMGSPRIGHTLTTLLDGRILIVGGWDGEYVPRTSGGSNAPSLTSTELFDPSDLAFRPGGALLAARSRHAAARLADGRVLVVGGNSGIFDTGNDQVESVELYNPTTDSFAATGSMLVPLDTPMATTLNDGRVLVIGDSQLKNAEVFDPATGTFAPAGSMTAVHGYGATATILKDGRVLILGGAGSVSSKPTAIAEVFDPATNSFTAIEPMRIQRANHQAILQGDGTVLVVGGSNFEGNEFNETAWCDLFDPATNTFAALPDSPTYSSDGAGVFLRRE